MRTFRNNLAVSLAGLALLLLAAPAAHAVVAKAPTVSAMSVAVCEPGTVVGEACVFDITAATGKAGEITVEQDGDQLKVTFTVTGIYTLATAGVRLFDSDPFANPAPTPVAQQGLVFNAPLPTTHTFTFDLTPDGEDPLFAPGECPYIQAAAELQGTPEDPDFDTLAASLPDTVGLKPVADTNGSPSYFDAQITSADPDLPSGTFDAWCVDLDRLINLGQDYTAGVYSSYEPPPAGAVDYPGNLDLVNFVINNFKAGDPSSCGGNFTSEDIQVATWQLIDDNVSWPLGYNACRVDEIIDAATASPRFREDGPEVAPFEYEPPCGGYIAIVLVPIDASGNIVAQTIIGQVIAIQLPTQCNPTSEQVSACFTCCLDGEIIVEKSTDPDASPDSFEFVPSWGDPFYLKDGESNSSGFLAAGVYSVSETVPDGWDLTSVTCTSEAYPNLAIEPDEIDLAKGDTVTCTFRNRQRGSLEVTKTVSVIAGTPTTTSFEICVAGPAPETTSSCKSFGAGQTQTWTNLVPGEYTVSENAIAESGWTVLVSGSPATVPAGGIAVASVTNTFEREDEFGCTYTQGYWKTHASGKKYDPTWANVGGPGATFFLSGQTYLQVMQMPSTGGNVYYILGQQYIAAKLNSYVASVPAAVASAITAAETFFNTYTPAQAAAFTSAQRAPYVALSTTLDNYNNGLTGPGHCD